jgi:hypothetical protein
VKEDLEDDDASSDKPLRVKAAVKRAARLLGLPLGLIGLRDGTENNTPVALAGGAWGFAGATPQQRVGSALRSFLRLDGSEYSGDVQDLAAISPYSASERTAGVKALQQSVTTEKIRVRRENESIFSLHETTADLEEQGHVLQTTGQQLTTIIFNQTINPLINQLVSQSVSHLSHCLALKADV